jgi:hypothetical protein
MTAMTTTFLSQVLALVILAGGIWLGWQRWARPIAAKADFQQRGLLFVLITTMVGGFVGAPFWWMDYPASFSWDLPPLAARMLAAAGAAFGIAGILMLRRLDPRVVRLYLIMLAVYLTPLVLAILLFHLDRLDWRAPITYAFFIVAGGLTIAALWHLVRGTTLPVATPSLRSPAQTVQLLLAAVAIVTGLWAVALFISPTGPSRFVWIWPDDALTSRLIATMLLTLCVMSALGRAEDRTARLSLVVLLTYGAGVVAAGVMNAVAGKPLPIGYMVVLGAIAALSMLLLCIEGVGSGPGCEPERA